MNSPIAVGLAAGVGAALLFAAGAGGPFITKLLLFLLAPLPMFLAGLGWGPRAMIAAGAAGMATSALLINVALAIVFLAAMAVPVPLLCWLAHLRRPASDSSVTLEWYPAGRLIAWIAVIAGFLAALSVLMVGTSVEEITKETRAFIERVMQAIAKAGGRTVTTPEIDAITTMFVRFMPAATAMSWMFMMVSNLWLAGRILRTSGRLSRDWPSLPGLVLPSWLTIALAAALVLSFAPGVGGLMAGGFVSAFLAAYAVLGLAVVHWITYGKAGRAALLTLAYVACFVLAPYGTIPIAILGLLEMVLRLRSRTTGPPSPPAASSGQVT